MILTRSLSLFAFLMGFSPPLSIFGANAAWVGFALLWGTLLFRKGLTSRIRSSPMDKPILFFLLIWFITSCLGFHPFQSLKTFPSQLHFVVFFLLIWPGEGKFHEAALKGYFYGVGVAVLYGLGQYLLSPFLGPGARPALDWLGNQGLRYATLANGRVHGAVHPLTYAEVLLPGFFFSVAYFLESNRLKNTVCRFVAMTLAELALILSQSRGPWLGALAGLLIIGVLHPKRLRLLPPLVICATFFFLHPGLRNRAATLSESHRDPSATIRLALWRDGSYIVRHNLWHGVGPGQIKQITQTYKEQPDFPFNPYGFESDMHNLYLQHFAERGIFGLLSLLWLMFLPLLLSWKAYRLPAAPPKEKSGSKTVLMALVAYFCSFFVVNLTERAFDDAEVALVFWILTAAAVKYFRRRTDEIDFCSRSPS